MIRLKILSWEDSSGLFGWILNAIISIFTIKRQRKLDEHGRLGEDGAKRDLKLLALKIRVLWLQAQKCQQPPESGIGKGWTFWSLQRAHAPPTPRFQSSDTLASRTVRE